MRQRMPWLTAVLILYPLCGCSPPGQGALENGSFHADLDGVKIHYEVHGSGPVLMTVPNSWGLSIEGMRGLFRPLEERLTMVYFDPRGIGRSGAVREEFDLSAAAVREDFDALRRHLGLERVNAIGWSNGATNLLLLAAEKPEILESAIFAHTVAHWGPEDGQAIAEKFPDLFERFQQHQQRMQSEQLTDEERDEATKELMVTEWFPMLTADPQGVAPSLSRVFAEAGFSFLHSAYSQTEWPSFDMRPRLASIPIRSLVIVGTHDMLPVERGRALADGLPDAELVVFENSGHFSQIEEPEKFETAVLDFLGLE